MPDATPMLLVLDTAWWLTFASAVGLAIGSFLNVVIYRIPLGMSVNEPRNSFCPGCLNQIRWYDNLPLFSFLMLRGRCRFCRSPIALRYPVIEVMFALIVVLLVDAFMVSQVRSGLLPTPGGVSWSLVVDGPVLLAHVILFAALLAMSAIDLDFYWVDIRATHLAAGAGLVLHTLWTPMSSIARGTMPGWPRPTEAMAVTAAGALLGLGVSVIFGRRFHPAEDESDEGSEVADPPPALAEPQAISTEETPPLLDGYQHDKPVQTARPVIVAWALLLVLGIVGLGALSQTLYDPPVVPFVVRALGVIGLLFGVLLIQSTVHRDSDSEIAEAIHAERGSARLMALEEMAMLLPCLLGAAMAWWLYQLALSRDVLASGDLFQFGWGYWHPLLGLGTAVVGYIVGGGVGWLVRVAFTILFGKEALGVGDIHILAAAGAVAGWQVATAGFVLSCLLAFVGFMVVLPFKRSRAIPLGPWLSLAFLILVVFYEPFVNSQTVSNLVTTVQFLTEGAG